MAKSEVYSWRVDAGLKRALEEAARAEKTSVARLLDRIASDWLAQNPEAEAEAEEQGRRLRAAQACFGTIRGGDPSRSKRVRELVRTRLEGSRETKRPD